jgi:hypothetical protein
MPHLRQSLHLVEGSGVAAVARRLEQAPTPLPARIGGLREEIAHRGGVASDAGLAGRRGPRDAAPGEGSRDGPVHCPRLDQPQRIGPAQPAVEREVTPHVAKFLHLPGRIDGDRVQVPRPGSAVKRAIQES